jgi:hypothetical protein
MKSKALVVKSIFEMTENRAKRCQVYGHSSFQHPGIGPQNRQARGGLFLTSRTYLLLVFFLGLPAVLGAQTRQSSWSNLNGLKAGQGIALIEFSMKRHNGGFVTVCEESLTLKENGSDVSIYRKNKNLFWKESLNERMRVIPAFRVTCSCLSGTAMFVPIDFARVDGKFSVTGWHP